MIETECQKLVVDAVKEGGGQALKLSNRFMIGVCDLFVKLPTCQPMLLEAKLHNLSDKTQNHVWDVGCTKLQQDFLRNWHEAGMLTGVVSFIQTTGKGVASLRMAIHEFHLLEQGAYSRSPEVGPPLPWCVEQALHRPLGGPDERYINIRQQLLEFANG